MSMVACLRKEILIQILLMNSEVLILEHASSSFDWSNISQQFRCDFESTLNPEKLASFGNAL